MASNGRYGSAMRTSRKPDDVATFWRRYKATPIGAPADGLCAGCDRAIFRGDTVRISKELRVVHWDCWHRDLSWRSGVSDDLSSPHPTVFDATSMEPEGFDH
jgi:hypothetical protein